MSIINQVLNELEKRGANTSMGETTIRSVPPRRQLHWMRYALGALVLLFVLAIVKWFPVSKAPVAAELAVAPIFPISASAVAASGPEISAVSAPVEVASVSSVTVTTLPGLRGKPLLEVASDEVAVVAPEVKKEARSKPKRAVKPVAEYADNEPADIPENQPLKKISPQQRAENEFRKANQAVQEGRTNDALAGYEGALLIDSSHKAARRAWVGVLVSLKRNDEAEQVLQRGVKRDPKDTSFAMLLARLEVERGALPLALETLQKALPYAEGQADYYSFVAALLQRQSRHEEAVAHYQIALKLVPNNGIWLMGMGISLQALQRNEDARDAYQRALATNTLNPQLQAFVQQKLKAL